MSSKELFNKKDLPLFPLPIVLFPGTMLPLHIFEERYKQMMKDCLEGSKIFGICFHSEKDGWPPPEGRIGAIAQIMAVVPLDDGRMNILTIGGTRFRVARYNALKPYLKAEVELIQDHLPEDECKPLMGELKKLYEEAGKALKELNDEQVLPTELPDTPEEFSFAIASVLQLTVEEKQQLLEIRSSLVRLKKLKNYLAGIVDQYSVRSQIHSHAKLNGHSHHNPSLIKEMGELPDEN